MRYLISSIVLLLCALSVTAKDIIMLRNGLEKEVYVVQVGNDKIVYKESKGKNATEEFLNLEDVYMISYEKRGIVYITQDGKRVSEDAESMKALKKKASSWVYLVKGKIYPAYNLKISENEIEFKRLSGKDFSSMIFNKNDIFLIRYSDGTKDIITEFKPKEVAKSVIEEPLEIKPEEPVEDVQQVIFHNVKSGDTLAKLAKRYNVTVEEIKEWNELPAKLKPTARLQTDMQLMLYVDVVTTEK